MPATSTPIRCDGCGLSASATHIADRLQRLELATRYRPIHMSVLFVALAPDPQHDFYGLPQADPVGQALLSALEIAARPGNSQEQPDAEASSLLAEFQHRGYYMGYISECPLPLESSAEQIAGIVVQQSPALILRIKHNYRPHKIALLGSALRTLVMALDAAGLGPPLLDRGAPFELPRLLAGPSLDPPAALTRFRAVLAQQ